MIFVFGSNEAGRHGKGAALAARKRWGAVHGQGFGLQGRSFAIPTKDFHLQHLPLEIIAGYVREFIKFVEQNPDKIFCITAIGTGLAGHCHKDIAPMFDSIKGFSNCFFPVEWKPILEEEDE